MAEIMQTIFWNPLPGNNQISVNLIIHLGSDKVWIKNKTWYMTYDFQLMISAENWNWFSYHQHQPREWSAKPWERCVLHTRYHRQSYVHHARRDRNWQKERLLVSSTVTINGLVWRDAWMIAMGILTFCQYVWVDECITNVEKIYQTKLHINMQREYYREHDGFHGHDSDKKLTTSTWIHLMKYRNKIAFSMHFLNDISMAKWNIAISPVS